MSWGVGDYINENGEFTTEAIENFICLSLLRYCFYGRWETRWKELGKCRQVLWKAVKIVFLFSLSIEFTQLFLRLGTFQLSDLAYNTLGGLVGGFIYWVCAKGKNKKHGMS